MIYSSLAFLPLGGVFSWGVVAVRWETSGTPPTSQAKASLKYKNYSFTTTEIFSICTGKIWPRCRVITVKYLHNQQHISWIDPVICTIHALHSISRRQLSISITYMALSVPCSMDFPREHRATLPLQDHLHPRLERVEVGEPVQHR